ncbi:E3 ubiquitin-protein ligase MIB2 isoform X2 [Leptopilina heterotoma]|uniref:E3 ubiquitin-protein ligase MIB2 isoform X2 n=1 Tax=Leptopilina heterotoma TaxID=63436 RepID=UPI001CA89C01|nr:E3 ubiquitin-protein ligase MIB2 isoform X2 [Leptopilina heterotoma]
MLEVGVRVVRGKDWKWGDQDGGEGHTGTVVEIGKPYDANSASSTPVTGDKTPDKTVIVQWDHGPRSNYRIGYQDSYDLLLYDNAPIGVKHPNIICDGCKKHGIFGMRWKCAQCFDYDLCTQCYMADVHDLNHTFQRFQTLNSAGVQLPARDGCTKVMLRGIFIGAKVSRGTDWEWSNQDGGRGKTGRVMDIRGWDNESSRSVATVTWSSGSTNVYRVGYKGCVDLCYVEEANGGVYYKDHLPLLGQPVSIIDNPVTNGDATSSENTGTRHLTFLVGDKVKVMKDINTLKTMQEGHGGWNPRMGDYLGQIGVVHRITDKGDIRVQYEGCNNRWTFHPAALTKIMTKDNFSVGDIVRIKSDSVAVKNYQRGHGEWIDVMKTALGKTGKIIKIYPDGDMRVALDGHIWTFNPLSVILVNSNSELGNSAAKDGNRDRVANNEFDSDIEKLLRATVRCESTLNAVREFLRKHPDKVDARAGGPGGGSKTCLQVAAHQGIRDLCIFLLDSGASLHAVDEDGDSPLHYAAFGDQPEIMELLLDRGAPINAVNNGKCSALHVAVNKQQAQCVHTLLRHGCDVNLQDSYGDTALHDAIGKDALDITDALCACERLNFTLRNKRGFNVLHHAALKGNAYATEKVVLRAQHLVNVKKDDGFAALHLAALNGHREVAEILLSPTGGRANVDLRNNRRQTALHLATSQGHWALVELLLRHKADISSTDEDGDTALHIAIKKSRSQPTAVTPESCRDSPLTYVIWLNLARQNTKTEFALTCYLISQDRSGNLLEQAKNSKGKSPLDLLQSDEDPSLPDVLRSYYNQNNSDDQSPQENNPASSNENGPTNNLESIGETEVIKKYPRSSGGDANECQSCRGTPKKIAPGGSVTEEETKEGNERNDEIENKHQETKENKEKDKNLERLRYLETRVADLEEAHLCSICMERVRNVAFLCGHLTCHECAIPLKNCPICRQKILKKINLY